MDQNTLIYFPVFLEDVSGKQNTVDRTINMEISQIILMGPYNFF